jgi:uncharacterized membrane protein
MHVILGLLGSLIGLSMEGFFGACAGAVVGVLIAEILSLRRRLTALEAKIRQPGMVEEVVFTPVSDAGEDPAGAATVKATADSGLAGGPASMPISPQPDAGGDTALDRFFAALAGGAGSLLVLVTRFFTGGNLVLKIGVLILFFGVAFLLKYAAQRDLVPLEFRLFGVAIGGAAMLGGGWLLRRKQMGYGLLLQGGGIGILYLVVYAAARLYHMLPMSLSLAVMIGLVAISSLLAVLQQSRALAIAGTVGGFLAPVLMSTGGGSHVLLFSYYALLNSGILAIAWFRSWRELNLLGFFFTFAIATIWGAGAYQPSHFASTEPFLVFFFLLYVAVSILFAHRQPVNLRGFVDGPLVFGLPLVVSALQYQLVRDFAYGAAVSALALGLFYATLAALLRNRLQGGMRQLTEAFLALAVVFGSLAIPLAFDNRWTSAAWSLEGAAMIWVGVRQQRQAARLFALLLQFGAAVFFSIDSVYPYAAPAFLNHFFFGCLFISVSSLFSSWYLDGNGDRLRPWERYLPLPLLVWGLLWWYGGGWREAVEQFAAGQFIHIALLFVTASTMLMTMIGRAIAWHRLLLAQMLQLPAMTLFLALGLQGLPFNGHLFAGWGLAVWLVAVGMGYRLLYLVEDRWPWRLAGFWHVGFLVLVLVLLSHESAWMMRRLLGFAEVWQLVCWGLIPAAAVFGLVRWGRMLRWPCGKFIEAYLLIGASLGVLWLVVWNIYGISRNGDPDPLFYLPLVNPLELSQLLSMVVILSWGRGIGQFQLPALIDSTKRMLPLLTGGIGFLALNGMVARVVHFYGNVPYSSAGLYHSSVFQAAIAALWCSCALVVTVWAARRGNRFLWFVGAVLLAVVVVKLFAVDLAGTGTVARIVSFLVVGGLMLVIGYFSPLPPVQKQK